MPAIKPRSLASVLRWVLPLAMALACTEHAAETRPSPTPSTAAKAAEPAKAEPTKVTTPVPSTEAATPIKPTEVVPPAVPAVPAEVVPPAVPAVPAVPTEVVPPAEPKELTDTERVDAYVASCSHQFTEVDEELEGEEGSVVNECDAYGWDQNCTYDPSGCWDAGQDCLRACAKPCNACQDECAGECDQCKAACAPGATDCIRKCAESRLTCRTKCMDASTACRSVDCPAKEKKCNETFNAKRKKKCPDCTGISNCFMKDHGDEDHEAACAREFPKANKVCLSWCMEYYEE